MRFLKISFFAIILSFIGNCDVCCSEISKESNEINSLKNSNNDMDSTKENSKFDSAKDFINDIGNQVIKILVNKSIPLAQRQDQFRKVIQKKFHMSSIGKFVLGRYWRQATPDQQKEYLKLFEDSIVESYSHQFDNYNNEQLQVTNVRPSSNGGTTVTSKIIRASGAPLQVDWKVFLIDGEMRILDVIVNGVSMSITYRTDYANAYNANGRSIEGLLKALSSKEVITQVPETSN